MGILSSIRAVLSDIKLYNLSNNSLIYKELCAYEVGFEMISVAINEILKDCFIETCTPPRLKEWEKLLNIPFSSTVPIDIRREIVSYKLAAAPNDFTLNGITNSIRSAGVEAEITEDTALSKLVVKFIKIFGQSDNLDIIKRQIYDILPAHLDTQFDMGSLTWADFDNKNYTFAQLDSKDFTWEFFDLSGSQL